MMKLSGECVLPDTHTTLQRLLDVVTDIHTVHQLDRQLILLETFLTVTGDSVKLADLELLTKVMTFLMSRLHNSSYRKAFRRILDVIKTPPKMEKSSDELNFKPDLVQFFTSLGYFLLQTKSREIMPQIVEVVHKILLTKRPVKSGLAPVKMCIEAIEVSEIMECLADFLAIADGDFYHWTIYTTLQICLLSDFCCWTVLTKNIVETLLVRLTMLPDAGRSEVLGVTFQLLWQLFNCTNHSEDWLKVPTPSLLALRSLRYVLREEALVHAHPGHDFNRLNNIAAITLKIIHLFPDAEYDRSGLIEDFTFSATMTETISTEHIVPYFKNESYHLQFKKLMLACLSLCPISSSSISMLKQYKLAECLVSLMGGDSPCGIVPPWSIEDMIDLFRCSIPVVCALFDYLHQEFIDAGLMKRLIKFLEVHYIEHNNLPDDLARTVVQTILSLCSRNIKKSEMHSALREAGAVSVLLKLCKNSLKPGSPLKIHLQSMIFYSLCVLASLMKNRPGIQQEHAETCFYIVTTLYQRILKPLQIDSVLDNRLIVAVSNFAWEILVWNETNILAFISSGNVFTHIDILERSPFSVQLVYLSMLVDLCEYYQSVPYLVSWRGRGGVKLLSVLCKIWRAEEKRLLVPRGGTGEISDIERPLMGEDQFELSKQEKKNPVSVCDVFRSARPKIYAIVQLLHRHKKVTELCEEHYRLGHDQLPSEDQVTLQLIEAYLPLKMGEIWWEIRNKQDAVVPLDRYLAETLADRYLNWSLSVQRAQHSILQKQDDQLRAEEQQYYARLRSIGLTGALEALREVIMIAHTADRQMLLRSHRKLVEGIEASRATVDTDITATYTQHSHVIVLNSTTDVVLSIEPDGSSAG